MPVMWAIQWYIPSNNNGNVEQCCPSAPHEQNTEWTKQQKNQNHNDFIESSLVCGLDVNIKHSPEVSTVWRYDCVKCFNVPGTFAFHRNRQRLLLWRNVVNTHCKIPKYNAYKTITAYGKFMKIYSKSHYIDLKIYRSIWVHGFNRFRIGRRKKTYIQISLRTRDES